ncbi:hypothetical protein AB0L97_17695 [Nocardia sp. NPDC051911]|uniref:hypothetical protein n=1 Tax=Nocardia sp. NPDC051911 TaxID=3154648 RepID=UPI00344434E7
MQIIEFTTCDPSVATSTLSATLRYVEGATDIQEVPDGLSSLIALDDNKSVGGTRWANSRPRPRRHAER